MDQKQNKRKQTQTKTNKQQKNHQQAQLYMIQVISSIPKCMRLLLILEKQPCIRLCIWDTNQKVVMQEFLQGLL